MVDRIPWQQYIQDPDRPGYLQRDQVTIYCGTEMMRQMDGETWYDTESKYVIGRSYIPLIDEEGKPGDFCHKLEMITVVGSDIMLPGLPAGDRTAVIVVCPVILDRMAGIGLPPWHKKVVGTVREADKQLVFGETHLDVMASEILSPTMFHEMCHAAMNEDSKEPL
jgi:hypothetical protein